MNKWYEEANGGWSNIISSRIRLVRNWEAYPFPPKLNPKSGMEMLAQLEAGLGDLGEVDGRSYVCLHLQDLSELDRAALKERRVLNTSAALQKAPGSVIFSKEEDTCVVLNGDDHIRIQLMAGGLRLDELWQRANQLDDYINARFPFAFDKKYGYLTTFPTNVGTGLRASVIVHLPTLSMGKKFNSLIGDLGRFGTTIRGVRGEGSDNYGALFEVYNQKTLGQTEKEIIDLVKKAAKQLTSQERQVRELALKNHRLECVDEVYKSYGVLRYARRLSEKDAMTFLSQVMTGMSDGLLKTKVPCSVFRLMLGIQQANLQKLSDRPLSKEELDVVRAEYLRRELPELEE